MNRRTFLATTALGAAGAAAGLSLPSCRKRVETAAAKPGEVVLYSSADPDVLTPIREQFEKQTGLVLRAVGDTEATKTTGLVQRLLSEIERPRADVWWSSEALGTVRLAAAGALAPYRCPQAETAGWPAPMRGEPIVNGAPSWYGFAKRARAIVFNTGKRKAEQFAPHLLALSDAPLKGRIGIARPHFGTTRSHVAAVLALHGAAALKEFLAGLKANGVRLYDGNATVVRAVANGEIDAGLTDTDDVYAGQRNGWPVEMVPARIDLPAGGSAPTGVIEIPNTVALIKGGPNPDAGKRLVDFLLSEAVERTLASMEARHIPVHTSLAGEFGHNAVGPGAPLAWDKVGDAADEALKIVDETLTG